MELLFDLHTHTIASGHAYSTLQENITAAAKAGLKAYGFSDHSEKLEGAPNNIWFDNFKVIPKEIDGMFIFGGAEVNIMDYDGNIDLDERRLKKIDYCIASMHTLCIKPGTVKENTNAYINVMDKHDITILGHIDDGRYPIDFEKVILSAKTHGVWVEINNSSLRPGGARQNGPENIRTILKLAKKHEVKVVVGTDSHISYDIGKFDEALAVLNEVDFPKELIMNTSLDNLTKCISKRKHHKTEK